MNKKILIIILSAITFSLSEMPKKLDRRLVNAVGKNDLKEIELCLEKGANINVRILEDGTLLGWSVLKNNYALAKFLINKGADVNIIFQSGRSAIYYAIEFGYLEITQLLIDEGADVNNRDFFGCTILDTCCTGRQQKNGYAPAKKLRQYQCSKLGSKNTNARGGSRGLQEYSRVAFNAWCK